MRFRGHGPLPWCNSSRRSRAILRLARALLGMAAVGCSNGAPATTATLWPEADQLFHTDSRWIGGDGAYSVDLGAGRVLWLFGDSFIAETPARVRDEAFMVRNSVAIQTGYDPSRAFMRFYWLREDDHPRSFIPEDGKEWYWPVHGLRVDDSVVLFYERVRTPAGNPSGFESAGWTAVRVDDPDDEPSAWTLEPTHKPKDDHGVQLGSAVLREGEFAYVYGERSTAASAWWLPSVARAAASARRVSAGAWPRPPPISSSTSCRRLRRCASGCSRCRSS